MELTIAKTKAHEAPILLKIQQQAFAEDLKKYQDHETNPANESIERLASKIELFLHYTIWYRHEIIGGIDVRDLKQNRYRLNRIFLANDYHYFYEKLGYKKLGEHQVSEKLILFDYVKKMND